jgi:hypothetical protein
MTILDLFGKYYPSRNDKHTYTLEVSELNSIVYSMTRVCLIVYVTLPLLWQLHIQ